MPQSQTAVAKDNKDDGREPRPFDSELPKNTPITIGTNAITVKRFVCRAQEDSGGAMLYNLFIAFSPDVIRASESRREIICGKGIRVYYDDRLRHLIVKLVDGPHKVAGVQLNCVISDEFSAMGLQQAIIGTGAKRIKKIFDKQRTRPFLEAAFSGTEPNGQMTYSCGRMWIVGVSQPSSPVDVEWWLVHSRGDVQIVILVSVHQRESYIVLETWVVDPDLKALRQGPVMRSSSVSTMRLQEVVISRNQQGVIQTVGVR